MISEELKEEIEECFDIFDKDKDGTLNQEEYQAAIKALEEGFE